MNSSTLTENTNNNNNTATEGRKKSVGGEVFTKDSGTSAMISNGTGGGTLVIVKVQLRDDIRRVPIHNEDITFDELVLMLQRMFRGQLKPDDDITVKYKDEDGDMITINDSSDLAFAIQYSRVLKLRVYFKKDEDLKNKLFKNLPIGVVRSELRELRDKVNYMLDLLDVEDDKKILVDSGAGDKKAIVDANKEKQVVAASLATELEFDPLQKQQGLGGAPHHIQQQQHDKGGSPPFNPSPSLSPSQHSLRQQPQGQPSNSATEMMAHNPQPLMPPTQQQQQQQQPGHPQPPQQQQQQSMAQSQNMQQQPRMNFSTQPTQPQPVYAQVVHQHPGIQQPNQQQQVRSVTTPQGNIPPPMGGYPPVSTPTSGSNYPAYNIPQYQTTMSGQGHYGEPPSPFSAQARPNVPTSMVGGPQVGQPAQQQGQYPPQQQQQPQGYPQQQQGVVGAPPPQQSSYLPPQPQYPGAYPPPPPGPAGLNNPYSRPPAPYKTQ